METGIHGPVFTEGFIIMPYKYSVGSMASKFFINLRDKKKIYGAKCASCNLVTVPPRSVCVKCYQDVDEMIELTGQGILQTYTVIHYQSPAQLIAPPYVIGIIQLDGASTAMTHFIGGVDIKDIHIGMRLEPVFKDQRQGEIADIRYFRPVKV